MCKVGKKTWTHYIQNKRTKKFITELESEVGIPKSKLIQSKEGGRKEVTGTWVHPHIATHLAMWISPMFAVKVSGWIEEWKLHNALNKKRWEMALHNLKPSENSQREREIQVKLSKELNAEMEIKTEFGYTDLLSDTCIIEIKNSNDWKCALGQILAYSKNYPNREKWIYLFGGSVDNLVVELCQKYNVNVKYL